jgi:hypothetical protein
MTTPEDAANDHVRRPTPHRLGPRRARASQAKEPPAGPPLSDEPTISEAVSNAVKTGYDVIAENIKQGREAAERFRKGEYNIREVPGDLEEMGLQLLRLARELSATTFDVCERLLRELRRTTAAGNRAQELDPFRPSTTKAPATASPASPSSQLKVTIRFTGGRNASSRTESLTRPTKPTAPDQISVTPLSPRAGGEPISGITFEVDMAVEGLVAIVAISRRHVPGVYSGLVFAEGQDIPLGVLTIEVFA